MLLAKLIPSTPFFCGFLGMTFSPYCTLLQQPYVVGVLTHVFGGKDREVSELLKMTWESNWRVKHRTQHKSKDHCTVSPKWWLLHIWTLTTVTFLPVWLPSLAFFAAASYLLNVKIKLHTWSSHLFHNTILYVMLDHPQVFRGAQTCPQLNSHIPRGYRLFPLGHFALHCSLLPLCFPLSRLKSSRPKKPPISFHPLQCPQSNTNINGAQQNFDQNFEDNGGGLKRNNRCAHLVINFHKIYNSCVFW